MVIFGLTIWLYCSDNIYLAYKMANELALLAYSLIDVLDIIENPTLCDVLYADWKRPCELSSPISV